MKNNLYKFLQIQVYVPLILFLGSIFALYNIIKITIYEPEEYFNYGKTPMYFVILIVGFCAIGLLAFTIHNFKKSGIDIKRYTQEEKEKLLEQNKQNNQKELRFSIFLPMAIMFTLMGSFITYMGFKTVSEDSSIFIFIFLGIMFVFVGIIMLIKFFEKE